MINRQAGTSVLAALRRSVKLVRVRRRFKRINKLPNRVQCFVAESKIEPALFCIEELVLADRAIAPEPGETISDLRQRATLLVQLKERYSELTTQMLSELSS